MNQIILSQIKLEDLVILLTSRVEEILEKNSKTNTDLIIPNSNECEYLSIKETAEFCKVKSPTTLWNWKQKGKLIPTHKAGKKPLYKREDVVNFLKRENSIQNPNI